MNDKNDNLRKLFIDLLKDMWPILVGYFVIVLLLAFSAAFAIRWILS